MVWPLRRPDLAMIPLSLGGTPRRSGTVVKEVALGWVRLAILSLVVAGTATLAMAPAHADEDGWHHRRHEEWHHRWHRDDDGWRRPWGVVVAPPPVYYRPPPVYYRPPPVYYAPPPPPVVFAPGLSIGIGVR